MSNELKIDTLKATLEEVLVKYDLSIATRADSHGRGDIYSVRTKEALLEVTLSDSWIGYELTINRDVIGHKIGTSLDTDNYALAGRNKHISLEIFDETLQCLRALLTGKIYIGIISGKPSLAVPHGKEDYRVIRYDRFVSHEETMSAAELATFTTMHHLE